MCPNLAKTLLTYSFRVTDNPYNPKRPKIKQFFTLCYVKFMPHLSKCNIYLNKNLESQQEISLRSTEGGKPSVHRFQASVKSGFRKIKQWFLTKNAILFSKEKLSFYKGSFLFLFLL